MVTGQRLPEFKKDDALVKPVLIMTAFFKALETIMIIQWKDAVREVLCSWYKYIRWI